MICHRDRGAGDRPGTRQPAARAGVEDGDLIIAFKDHPTAEIDALHRLLTADEIGLETTVTVLRRTEN